MTERQRTLQVMGIQNAEQRRAPRHSVHASGSLSAGNETHVAWVKDISESGALVYVKHSPEVGESVRLSLDSRKAPSSIRNAYEGTVVRVQRSRPGAAVGVAVLFSLMGALFLSAI